MFAVAGITVTILSSIDKNEEDEDEATAAVMCCGCILVFFACFMIGFGGKCVELNDNYQGSIYCGPGGEGGGIAMICIGSIMLLAGCATCVCEAKKG